MTDKINKLALSGIKFIDKNNVYIEEQVTIDKGTVIYPGVFIESETQIGKNCIIEPGCMIKNSKIASNTILKAGSYIDESVIGSHSKIGPYAHIRENSTIGKSCKVGNFVEFKKVVFGDNSKAAHITYLGDAVVGKCVNIGCGAITCNYREDKKKYQTIIEDNVFVGSDVQLVAPVKIGKGAIIGSGSTITKDIPADALAIARTRETIKKNWVKNKTCVE